MSPLKEGIARVPSEEETHQPRQKEIFLELRMRESKVESRKKEKQQLRHTLVSSSITKTKKRIENKYNNQTKRCSSAWNNIPGTHKNLPLTEKINSKKVCENITEKNTKEVQVGAQIMEIIESTAEPELTIIKKRTVIRLK